MKRVLLAIGLAMGAMLFGLITLLAPPPSAEKTRIDLQQALSDEGGEFAEVSPGRHFQFPRDHGSHPEFKTEWWYFTGHLQTESERWFGYQVTLFRVGLPGTRDPKNESLWNSDAIMMGHLALSDPLDAKFRHRERFSRTALGLAGVEESPVRVWLEDWSVQRLEKGWSLQAEAPGEDGFSLDLTLSEVKAVVLQGSEGYSRKGPEPQHASYYVAHTRLATEGRLTVSRETLPVTGSSWFDHEWSSEAMAEGLVGWDWFSLQLDDQRELMLYLLRYQDGRLEPASSGSLIDREGKKRTLALQDFQVEVLDTHRLASGREYPSRWRVTVPSAGLDLRVEPTLAEQEIESGVPYWEGAVTISGRSQEAPLRGRGFVELTGY